MTPALESKAALGCADRGMPERIVVICGATATGKTELAVPLAERLSAEIIGADSRQVYRFMDVGTAKPSPEARARVCHHLIDVVDPDQTFDVAAWRAAAMRALAAGRARGTPMIVCGGTGLYLRSLLRGLVQAPPADEALRARLIAEERVSPGTLHSRLTRVDAMAGQRIHRNDTVRIVRALEVFELTGVPLTAWHGRHRLAERPFDALVIELFRTPEALRRCIDQRALAMVAAGLLEEVRALGERYDLDLKAFSAIGYREARDCLRGLLATADLAERVTRATRAYAKRQLVWLRGQMNTVKLPAGAEDAAYELASNFLAGERRLL